VLVDRAWLLLRRSARVENPCYRGTGKLKRAALSSAL